METLLVHFKTFTFLFQKGIKMITCIKMLR